MYQIFKIWKHITLHPFSSYIFFKNVLQFLLVFIVHFVKDEVSHLFAVDVLTEIS